MSEFFTAAVLRRSVLSGLGAAALSMAMAGAALGGASVGSDAGAGAGPSPAGALRLLMFHQPGCVYCARWEAEIGPVYPATDEAVRAPLTRLDIRDPLPAGITLDRPVALTPTFVVVVDGQEAGRLEGYGGEDFFWFLLGDVLEQARPLR